jgi:uncharacterized iron-regulated protein
MRYLTTSLVLLLALTATACKTAPSAVEPVAPASTPAIGDLVASPSGAQLSFAQMAEALRPMRAVYVGESHNNDFHHDMQFEVVKALYEQNPNLMIGFEMFQRPFQAGLDRFIAGETTETEFLKETEYFSRWKWDYRYYRPIFLFAREHGLKLVALNSPREANRRVSRGGGLSGLTDEDKPFVAEEIDLTNEAHREAVMGIFGGHPMMPGFDKEAFYASQCVWEDTMGESTARALAANPGSRIVVLAGGFHVRQRFGVPMRAERRGATPYAIVLGMDLMPGHPAPSYEEILSEDLGDYLFFTRIAPERAPTPKLGVMLNQKAGGPGLLITAVTDAGLADLAGVHAEDRLTGLSGAPISTLEDLQIALALQTKRLGTIDVLRGGEMLSLSFDTAWARP